MIGIALRIMLGWGKSLIALLADGLRWLFGAWYRPVIAALLCLSGALWLALGDMTSQRDAEHDALIAEQRAHTATINFYTEAAIIAEQRAKENAARVAAEYAAAAKGASDENVRLRADFNRRLAGFLRQQRGGAAADTGGAAPVDVPGSPALPAGPVPEPGLALVPVTDLERCAAIAAQLIALIGYVEASSEVPVTGAEVADQPQ